MATANHNWTDAEMTECVETMAALHDALAPHALHPQAAALPTFGRIQTIMADLAALKAAVASHDLAAIKAAITKLKADLGA